MQTEMEYQSGREIGSIRCESVGEYSLPDYNGDVKKILAVKTKVFPSGRFVGDGALEISGSVGYEVVYIDSENQITHAEFSTDYDAAVRINSDTYVDSDVSTAVAACNVRLVGPRKLSVKSTLESEVRIGERRVHSVEGDAFMEYEPETVGAVARVLTPSFSSGEMREMSEELLQLEGAIADEVEVLLSDASYRPESLESEGDSLTLKGAVVVSALVRNGDYAPRLVTKELAYTDTLSLPGADSLEAVESRVEIRSLKSTVIPTEDGVSITVSVTVAPFAYGKMNSTLGLVRDCFVKERGSVNEYADFGYTEHICTAEKTERLEVRSSAADLGIEASGDVIYTEAQARVERCEISESGVRIEGEVRFGGIAYSAADDLPAVYAPVKFTVPFSGNVNIDCQRHDNMRAYCAVNASSPKIVLDENSVNATVELTFFVNVTSDQRQRCLGSSYLTDEEFTRDASVVTVYYPDASESLFSIAKRFHTSVIDIAESNRLSESVFASSDSPLGASGVKKLIIK